MKGFLVLGIVDVIFVAIIAAVLAVMFVWLGRREDRRIEEQIEADRRRRQQRIAAVAARRTQERCPDYPPADWP